MFRYIYNTIINQISIIRSKSSLLHNWNFWVVIGGYTQTQTEGACCISENTYHRYCACAGKALSWCKDFCDNDSNCKGYFEYTPQPYCRVSTTTTCPSECTGPWDDGKDGELCSTCTCHSQNHGGCFIKNSGMYVKPLVNCLWIST